MHLTDAIRLLFPSARFGLDADFITITDPESGIQSIAFWNAETLGARDDAAIAAAIAAGPALVPLQTALCADIDAQAEAQRSRYITDGSGQAMVYLQKQTQAAQALAALAATPPMTADQGGVSFILLAAEIGITVDPSTKAPAVDVFGVARSVAATVTMWLPIAAAIEAMRLKTKAAISAATTAVVAQAAHDAVVWPAA